MKVFLADDTQTFQEYQELISNYNDLENRIIIESDRTVYTTFFEINRGEFLEMIEKTVGSLKNMLLNELVVRYQAKTKK